MGLPRMERSCEDRGYRYAVGSVAILEARSACLRLLVVVGQLAHAIGETVWGWEAWSNSPVGLVLSILRESHLVLAVLETRQTST
jgi:hypothetical protein